MLGASCASQPVLGDRFDFIFRIGVVALLLSPSWVHGQSGDDDAIRVMSFNIHHGVGTDGQLDLERIARVIREQDPDFVALQEVDQDVRRSGGIRQADRLSELTGMHVAFGKNIDLQGGEYGTAILSREPIEAAENHQLPNLNGGEQRGFLVARVQSSQLSQPVLFVSTHFDHRRDGEERLQSAVALNRWLAEQRVGVVILAGDLNDTRGSATLAELEKAWTIIGEQELPSIPSTAPRRQIDFVLVSTESEIEVVEAKAIDVPLASDHLPIQVDFRIRGERTVCDVRRTSCPQVGWLIK